MVKSWIVGLWTGWALEMVTLGGTVITQGLPANDAIVNIDARVDGSAAFNGDQSLWYHPFNESGGPLLQTTVLAETYGFRVISPADAAAMFPTLTAAQTNQMYAGWTYNSPWILNYLVFDVAAATNFSIPQIFDGAPEWPPFGNANDVYNASLAHGTYNQIRVGPQGRHSTNLVTSYTFNVTTTLVFAVPDAGLGDNGGGVSVLVSPVRVTLNVAAASGGVTLAWATNGSAGYLLESTPQLDGATWQPVGTQPIVQGDYYTVPVPSASGNAFFRLRKQVQ